MKKSLTVVLLTLALALAMCIVGNAQPLYPFGPSGGSGGSEFANDNIREESRISAITIRHGARIDGITITMENRFNGVQLEVFQEGGDSGEATTITLDRDEYIIKIEGVYGDRVDRLRIQTNIRTTQWFGGNGGDTFFEFEAPPRYEIIGFWGRSAREIDALGVFLRERPSGRNPNNCNCATSVP